MDIPVMHFFDNRYVIPAAVSFYSMLENASKEHNYILYVGHNDITLENQAKLQSVVRLFQNAKIEFINMAGKFSELFAQTKSKGHYTKEMYYKFLVPSLVPQHNKVIVTDVDVVFLDDISKDYINFNVNEQYYFGGVKCLLRKGCSLDEWRKVYEKEFSLQERSFLGFAGGYYIFNCIKMRKDSMERRFIEFAINNAQRLIQPEQDTISICCKTMKKDLHPRALVCTYSYDMYKSESDYQKDILYDADTVKYSLDNPIQLHYATSRKPWNSVCQKQEIWFSYLIKTGLFSEFIKEFMPENRKIIFKISAFNRLFTLTKEHSI